MLYNENMNYCECTPIKPKCKKVDGISIVVIPAQMGTSAEGELYAPKIGDYTNAVVKYLADGLVYVYDNTGNWTLVADYNAVTPTVDQSLNINSDNPIANRAVTRAINQLTAELAALDDSLATVAKTGDYDDLTNKPTIDTALSTTSGNAIANSAITNAINRPILYDLEMESDANSVTFTEDIINPVTGVVTQETDTIPTASTTTAGTISADEFISIKNSQDRLDALEGGSVAISGLSATPTQAELTTAWLTETGESALINRASIYDITNTKVWTYYTNTTTWYEVTAGTIQVNPFTNSVAGTILGSNVDGNVSANLDGTGTVAGWSTLVSTVNSKLDDSDLDDVAFIDDTIGHVSDTAYVGTANIQTGAVTTAKIADLNVTEGKLASNSVTTSKVADGAITSDKIDSTTMVALDIGTILQTESDINAAAGSGNTDTTVTISYSGFLAATLTTDGSGAAAQIIIPATGIKLASVISTGFMQQAAIIPVKAGTALIFRTNTSSTNGSAIQGIRVYAPVVC